MSLSISVEMAIPANPGVGTALTLAFGTTAGGGASTAGQPIGLFLALTKAS